MEDLKKKVLSYLRERFSKKKDAKRLAESEDLADQIFNWYAEGGPDLVVTKMSELIAESKAAFDEAAEAVREGTG